MQVAMAKSEIPSIVVHPGTGGCNNAGSVSEGAMSERPRLAKQEEVDMEEENFTAPSPITIHIQGERDGFGDRLEEEDSICEGDQVVLPTTSTVESSGGGSDSDGRTTDRTGTRSQGHGKGASKKLGKQGSSQGSQDGSSPSLSRDSSTETYTDSTGVDLQQFIIDTLHKSQKDRAMLLKIEQDLYTLVKDNKCQVFKFTPMSSYNRMLVHRVAAFFGMEHNIDKPGTSVIVNKTKNTRLPDVRFSEYIRDELVPEEPKKLILKRDSASFEEGKESPERQSSMDSRRSKSFEEREEEYEKARARIFNQDEGYGESPYSLRSQDGTLNSSRRSSQEDLRTWTGEPRPWSSTDSDSSSRKANSFEMESGPVAGNSSRSADTSPATVEGKASGNSGGLLHPNQVLSGEGRPSLTKASSFGGITLLTRDNSSGGSGATKGSHPHTPRLTKAESLTETSSSGRCNVPQLPQQQLSPCNLVVLDQQVVSSQQGEVQPARASPMSPAQQHPSQEATGGIPLAYVLADSNHPSLTDKNSSQTCQWEVQSPLKEEHVMVQASPTESHGAAGIPVNAGAALWPLASVDSIPPGSVLLNPTLATSHYFGSPETMVYQAKTLSPTQAYVVTPIHALKGPLLPSSPTLPINGKPVVTSGQQPQQQHQGNPSGQMGGIPVSQYGAVVYIPCVAAPSTLMGQQGSSNSASPSTATLQLITAQQQQQQQPQQSGEHRPNQAVMPDLVSQLSALTLTPPPPPPPPSASEMTSYLVPASGELTKLQPSGTPATSLKGQPAALTTQVPLYYMPQSPTGVFNGVRYVCPGGPPMILHGQPSNVVGPNSLTATPACCVKNHEGITHLDNSVAQSTSPHLVGHPQPLYPGYTFLGFPHHTLDSGSLHQVPTSVATSASLPYNFSVAHSPTNGAPPPASSVQPPTGPNSTTLLYPYNNSSNSSLIINSAIPNSSQQQQPPQQQQHPPQQQFFGQPSVCLVGNNGTSFPQSQYRPVAPSVLQGVSGAPANTTTAPYLSYTIYSPQNSNYSSLPSPFLHVLRPNFPTSLSGMRNPTPSSALQQLQAQGFQGVPVQLTSASALQNTSVQTAAIPQPHLPRGKVLLPTNKDVSFKETLSSAGLDVKFSGGVPRLHLSTGGSPSVCMPPGAPLYRQALPIVPDVRFLGRPLHQTHQLNPAFLLAHQQHQHQQRPRFTSHYQPQHQQQQQQQYSMGTQVSAFNRGASAEAGRSAGGGRKGKSRTPMHHKATSSTSVDNSHSPMEVTLIGNPLVLEVNGTPQGLRRNELERYLEPLVSNYGAKIQVLSSSGGAERLGDCLLNTPCKHQVLAVFQSEAAAQSALLNIKTPKFQLRSCGPCKHPKS